MMFVEIYDDKLRLTWIDEKGYFGNIDIYKGRDLRMKIITETMGKEFAKKLFNQLIDETDLID
jgi:hypothetical protein